MRSSKSSGEVAVSRTSLLLVSLVCVLVTPKLHVMVDARLLSRENHGAGSRTNAAAFLHGGPCSFPTPFKKPGRQQKCQDRRHPQKEHRAFKSSGRCSATVTERSAVPFPAEDITSAVSLVSDALGSPLSLETIPLSSATTMISEATSSSSSSFPISTEPIHTAFSIATFLPQPFWLLMILFPNAGITKKIMGGLEIPLLCCLIHFFIVASSIAQQGTGVTAPLSEFNDVFDPFGDPQLAFMGMTSKYPNFVAEEWSHVLTWDLFVGRYVWIDGLRRGIFTGPAVLFCNLIGPPGLLIHWITCALSGKPIFEPDEKEEIQNL